MPSKKRRRPATAEDDAQRRGSIHSSRRTPLASFSSLPYELREMIIQLACRSSSLSTRSPFAFDVATVHSLSLASRQMNAQMTPLLWGNVSITRPSALYALQQALLARPDRAKLITSLHIGPQDVLPRYWWPLSRTFAEDEHQYTSSRGRTEESSYAHWIATSLDNGGLPSGCLSRGGWRWDRSTPGCRGAAIYDALRVIRDQLGLNSEAHGRSDPTTIAPVFEAQAALDIYLGAIRRAEEEDPELARFAKPGSCIPLPCHRGECGHYPPLFITGAPKTAKPSFLAKRYSPGEQPHCNAFVLPYAQILCHLARSGSVIDRFDHPLPLARSGFNVLITAPAAAAAEGAYQPSKASYKVYSGTWDVRQHEAAQWTGHLVLSEAARQAEAAGKDKSAYAAAVCLATFGSIVKLAREVLARAVSLQNLSLTGYFECIVQGKTLPSSLSRLSLGPALPCWDAPLPLGHLENVEELRVCGRAITLYEACTIAAKMPKLSKLIWSMAERSTYGQNALTPATFSSTTHKEGEIEDADFSAPSASATAPPLVIFRIHQVDLASILRSTKSLEMRGAWLAGRPTSPSRRRLLLQRSDAASAVALATYAGGEGSNVAASHDSRSCFWEELYKEGRDYWRGGEGEAGHVGEEGKEEKGERHGDSGGPGH